METKWLSEQRQEQREEINRLVNKLRQHFDEIGPLLEDTSVNHVPQLIGLQSNLERLSKRLAVYMFLAGKERKDSDRL